MVIRAPWQAPLVHMPRTGKAGCDGGGMTAIRLPLNSSFQPEDLSFAKTQNGSEFTLRFALLRS